MSYHVNSPTAIAGGILAAGGAIALLVRDALVTGWTVELALMPVLVVLTILMGHHAHAALRRGKVLTAATLGLLALFGSAYTIYETMGRRAEVRDTKVAAATDTASNRQHLTQMLAEAEDNVTSHRNRVATACARGRNTDRCRGTEYTVKTWEAAVKGYKAEIAGLGAPTPIDPRGERVAAIAGMVGVAASPAAIQTNVRLLEPALFPMFLELGSIVLWGYGIGHARRKPLPQPLPMPVSAAPVALTTVEDDEGDNEAPVTTPRGGKLAHTRDEALADLWTLHKAGHQWPSQDWLRERWGLPDGSKGTVSRWMKRWERTGQLPQHRITVGRCKTIKAREAA